MLQVGLMIEGQDGLNWERWKRLLDAAEELGFPFVFRSDHFTNPAPSDKDSLELWTSLTYAAAETKDIQFGPLVAPVTFRHPSITARMAAAVDDLSGGRLVLGIGSGWQEREHRVFGVPFPATDVRLRMLREYLEIVVRLLRSDEPSTYQGEYFRLDGAVLLPRPRRSGGPPILIGGNGERRTLPLAAQFADEWNAVMIGPARLKELQTRLNELLEKTGRDPKAVRRSIMLSTRLMDESSTRDWLSNSGLTADEVNDRGSLVGTPQMFVEQIRRYAEAGAERVMLQWLDQDNITGIRILAHEVLPHV